jgi:beta-lactam-binding protein with PASTA domain
MIGDTLISNGARFRLIVSSPRFWAAARNVGIVATWIVVGGGLLVSVFGLSFYLAMRVEMRSTEVKVPELAGMTLEAAHVAAEAVDLVPLVVDQRHDPAVPSGRVLQQEPPDGTSVRRGRKVKLVLSLGGKVLQVPALVGQSSRAVEIELRQGGFVPGFEVRLPSSSVPSGTVLAQVPPRDTPAVPNTRVHRLVSSGPPHRAWVMPDLTGLRRDEVERWVVASGFRVAVRRVPVRTRTSGRVVGQLPLAGYPVHRNDIVELTVAR